MRKYPRSPDRSWYAWPQIDLGNLKVVDPLDVEDPQDFGQN